MEFETGNEAPQDEQVTLNQENNYETQKEQYEKYTNEELIKIVCEKNQYCTSLEQTNNQLNQSVQSLENSLSEQHEKCKSLEKAKTFLRENIKKASAHWFERKTRVSEGDQDQSPDDVKSIDTPDFVKECLNQSDSSFDAPENADLTSELKFKQEDLKISNRRCKELKKRVKSYESVIDDQEIIIRGLETQIETYFEDNNSMSKQLAVLHKLFVDLENINEKHVQEPVPADTPASSSDDLPTDEDFKVMSGSVTKTYMKLRELIYEKKSLVTEIERLQTLNVELQKRVSTQETRLIRVSDALQSTWLLVSKLKDEHEKLHTAETILRYELKGKREVLQKLKDELECSREQWHIIRQKNSETEQEWTILREEINERRRLRNFAENNGTSCTSEAIEEISSNKKAPSNEFEPPVDLLFDMGIECGAVNADAEVSDTALALVCGDDVHEERLQNLEEQCCFLYQKLMSSTARTLTLASHLSSLHEQYSESDEEDSEGVENEDFFDEDFEEGNLYENDVLSGDSESYDTAYVSETEGNDSALGVAETNIEIGSLDNEAIPEIINEEGEEYVYDNNDALSRRLITFLPRKIELLKSDIAKLEEKVQSQQEEKAKLEETLTAAIEVERKQKRHLEEQLTHLGKCVDELKLERNGKIAEVEEKLKKKVEEIDKEQKEHVELREEFEKLTEMYSQREELLQLTSTNLQETEEKLKELQENIEKIEQELNQSKSEFQEEKLKKSQTVQTETLGDSNALQANTEDEVTPHGSNCPSNEILQLNSPNLMELNNQLQRMVLLRGSSMKFGVNLSDDSVLSWEYQATPSDVIFRITEDKGLIGQCGEEEFNEENYTSNEEGVHSNSLKEQGTSQDLKEETSHGSITSSGSPSRGKISPQTPGIYTLVFENKDNEQQVILWKVWTEKKEEVET